MNGNGFTILNLRLFAEIIFYMINKIIRTEILVDITRELSLLVFNSHGWALCLTLARRVTRAYPKVKILEKPEK